MERQESSEQEGARHGKATLADIVEQLQEKESTAPPPNPPRDRDPPGRLPTEALPERTPRPDRPRARDRPKPRRRPRPKDGVPGGPGEGRRSRSAPAQGGGGGAPPPPPPPPPTHTVQHEGFLFRKHELDGPNKKASNRSWLNLYCVLSRGELAFYRDAKGPSGGGTHNGEPPLGLHMATSEVASDYKKKKNVFKLRRSSAPGSAPSPPPSKNTRRSRARPPRPRPPPPPPTKGRRGARSAGSDVISTRRKWRHTAPIASSP